ncbi:hypothetical protein J6590_039294 [Homalodisca vitripennis]|nr:hypothetical protein J6590_039294 [Homalodisca vitripennis]
MGAAGCEASPLPFHNLGIRLHLLLISQRLPLQHRLEACTLVEAIRRDTLELGRRKLSRRTGQNTLFRPLTTDLIAYPLPQKQNLFHGMSIQQGSLKNRSLFTEVVIQRIVQRMSTHLIGSSQIERLEECLIPSNPYLYLAGRGGRELAHKFIPPSLSDRCPQFSFKPLCLCKQIQSLPAAPSRITSASLYAYLNGAPTPSPRFVQFGAKQRFVYFMRLPDRVARATEFCWIGFYGMSQHFIPTRITIFVIHDFFCTEN